MRKVILFVALLGSIVSCTKDPIMYTFKGHAIEDQNGEALAGVEISISQKPFSTQVLNSNYESVGSVTTDANGNYELTFERTKVTEFKVEIEKQGYFYQEIIIGSGDVSSENDNIIDIEMEAQSFVQFLIQNTGQAESTDLLNLLLLNPKTGCPACPETDSYYYEGVVDTIVTFPTDAGRYYNFTYINVGVNSKTDSVFVTPFDTIIYSINY